MRTRPLERPVAPAPDTDRSTTTTRAPREARWKARLAPCTPAPMTKTSAVSVMVPPLEPRASIGQATRGTLRLEGLRRRRPHPAVEGDAAVAQRDPGVVPDDD